jgi:hypothetical protein
LELAMLGAQSIIADNLSDVAQALAIDAARRVIAHA